MRNAGSKLTLFKKAIKPNNFFEKLVLGLSLTTFNSAEMLTKLTEVR